MSSIRLFTLGSFRKRGEMHRYSLRLLAEQEPIDNSTDSDLGAIYCAIRKLAADELIAALPAIIEDEKSRRGQTHD